MKKDLIYVFIQMVLFALYLLTPDWGNNIMPNYLKIIGLLLGITGVIAIIIALLQLNIHLSPFPSPRPESKLIDNGIFGWVRHPIYSGIFLVTFGYGLYVSSLLKILIAVILLFFFNMKANYEEKLLQNHFQGYRDYIKRTGKFFPKWKKSIH